MPVIIRPRYITNQSRHWPPLFTRLKVIVQDGGYSYNPVVVMTPINGLRNVYMIYIIIYILYVTIELQSIYFYYIHIV